MGKKLYLYFFIALFAWTASSCRKSDEADITPVDRTVLIYMAADNSLNSYGYTNLQLLANSVTRRNLREGNLLVYLDSRTPSGEYTAEPKIIKIEFDENGVLVQNVVKKYPEHNSGSAEVLSNVISFAVSEYPAKEYGLILWSHGSGWLPSNPNYTKAFGQDGNSWIETNDLALAIPDNVFDFVVFDACYMGAVEVAFALRNKSDLFLASPTEIIADGFPYGEMVDYLFATKADIEGLARAYFKFYAEHKQTAYRSATISLVKTSELESLAAVTREIVYGKEEEIGHINIDLLQCFDRNAYHSMFDMGEFLEKIATPQQYATFTNQMNKTIIYKAHTDSFLINQGGFLIKRYSGLSSYIPVKRYPKLNPEYYKLDSYKTVYGDIAPE